MAKTPGLGAAIAVDDATGTPQTISNDVTDFTLATPRAVEDITGVDKSAHERMLLLADASVSLKGVFNPAVNMSHAVLSSITSGDVIRTVKITPTAAATPYLSFEALFENYELSRANTGALTFTAPGNLADGTPPAWVNS